FLFLDAELFDDDFLDALFDGAHGFAAPGGMVVGRTGAGSAARVSLIHKADSVVKSRGRWHPHENAGQSGACATFGVLFGGSWPRSGHVHAAVHVQGFTGDVVGVRTGEEGQDRKSTRLTPVT